MTTLMRLAEASSCAYADVELSRIACARRALACSASVRGTCVCVAEARSAAHTAAHLAMRDIVRGLPKHAQHLLRLPALHRVLQAHQTQSLMHGLRHHYERQAPLWKIGRRARLRIVQPLAQRLQLGQLPQDVHACHPGGPGQAPRPRLRPAPPSSPGAQQCITRRRPPAAAAPALRAPQCCRGPIALDWAGSGAGSGAGKAQSAPRQSGGRQHALKRYLMSDLRRLLGCLARDRQLGMSRAKCTAAAQDLSGQGPGP